MLKKRDILAAVVCLALAGCGKDKAPKKPKASI